MKKLLISITALISISLFSCQKKTGVTLQSSPLSAVSPSTVSSNLRLSITKSFANQLVLEDNYLDVDFANLKANTDTAKARASIYRFYKHVHLKDGFYVTDLNNATSIKVSNATYLTLLRNLNHMNDLKKTHELKGETVNFPEIDNTYLNSLIQ
jgi:poly(3-hydroxyalkanoate) synthetase